MNESAKKALLKLFQCFNLSGDETEREFKFRCYADVLGPLPDDVIAMVCAKASRGEVGGGFMPSSGELYKAGKAYLEKQADRRPPPAPMLTEYHYPAQWREGMKAKWAELIGNLGHAPDPCTPRSCTRRYGEACPTPGLRPCRSHDAAL